VLVTVIDTEEEFNWAGEFRRQDTNVSAMNEIHHAQKVFDEFGVRPCYAIDYPVATQPDGYAPMREFHSSGRAELGAHLHPWVTPPYEEALTPGNSYTCNLDISLQHKKLAELSAAIEAHTGVRPTVYKAGRYGIGVKTPELLLNHGYQVDLSTCPPFDFRGDGGPDFSRYPVNPHWMGPGEKLLALPTTGAFIGWLHGLGASLFPIIRKPAARAFRIGGMLSVSGALERIRLSPEGFNYQHLRRLADALLGRGVRVLTLSLHSTSMKPGANPYVHSLADRTRMLDTCRRFYEYFLGELHGLPMTPMELRRQLEQAVPL
jgi:hypothetical protein